jgi:hypothetical protein
MKERNFILILGILCMLFALCSDTFGGYKGKVIDEETGQSIEGAVFLMHWTLKCLPYGSEHFFDAKEILTDHLGMFKIENHRINLNPLCSVTDAPYFYIYKSGYKAIELAWVLSVFKKDEMKKYLSFEGDLIKFNLRKTKSKEERRKAIPPGRSVPNKYQHLLIREINKERSFFNLPLIRETD